TAPLGTVEAAVAVSGGMVLAALLLASAYGLLTMQGRSPLLATLAFALAIPIDAYHMLLLDSTPWSLGYRGLGIAVALQALAWFQLRNVRQLYQPRLAERQSCRTLRSWNHASAWGATAMP